MKIPAMVKVGCFDVVIVEMNAHEANAKNVFGEFSATELTIRIDITTSPVKIVDTLLHEINHAIYWTYKMENGDEEERVVSTYATAWTQVFRDNPAVLKFISVNLHG